MRLLLSLLLLLASIAIVRSETCAEKGLVGECNGCVCCCSKGGAFIRAVPRGCDCSRSVNTDDVGFAAVVAAVVLVPTMFASCWFGDGCCGSGSPFVPTAANRRRLLRQQQQQQEARMRDLPTAAVVSPPTRASGVA